MLTMILAATLLALQAPATSQAGPPVRLVIRVFNGAQEVTTDTRLMVYAAGSREAPLAVDLRPGTGHVAEVPTGLYDVQAVQQREGRVVNIRWAEHLVVMRYPDEGGEHLEVINFQPGFGALQVRPGPNWTKGPDAWQAALFPSGERAREAGAPTTGDGYRLFLVPAGTYDLRVAGGEDPVWLPSIEVPPDRTRLKVVPLPE